MTNGIERNLPTTNIQGYPTKVVAKMSDELRTPFYLGALSNDEDDFPSKELEDERVHSPTDNSEDSVEVKVSPISGRNKRKCAEPRRVEGFQGPLKKRMCLQARVEAMEAQSEPFRPWSMKLDADKTMMEDDKKAAIAHRLGQFTPLTHHQNFIKDDREKVEDSSRKVDENERFNGRPAHFKSSTLPDSKQSSFVKDYSDITKENIKKLEDPHQKLTGISGRVLGMHSIPSDLSSVHAMVKERCAFPKANEEKPSIPHPNLRKSEDFNGRAVYYHRVPQPQDCASVFGKDNKDFLKMAGVSIKSEPVQESVIVPASHYEKSYAYFRPPSPPVKMATSEGQNQPISLVKHAESMRVPIHPIASAVSPMESEVMIRNSEEVFPRLSSSSSNGNSSSRKDQRNYKNMTRERRIEANARERTRVHTISAAFETLRKSVPAYSHSQKLSKLSVLRIACSYIMTLSNMVKGDDDAVASCVSSVTNTIQREGKLRKKKDDSD